MVNFLVGHREHFLYTEEFTSGIYWKRQERLRITEQK
jgi:hypothetical protein